ncbi:hypothetical protein AMELA_G00265320 [Ameiurus melas]|uniref:Uncharacterized protein n=1 Tax=Ameiurus melas TaxID=219545 RepID=A0A7J5ZQ92_AMEME|nr:hypothetical protein AMELA_G00265320 [Ameiurus melas]
MSFLLKEGRKEGRKRKGKEKKRPMAGHDVDHCGFILIQETLRCVRRMAFIDYTNDSWHLTNAGNIQKCSFPSDFLSLFNQMQSLRVHMRFSGYLRPAKNVPVGIFTTLKTHLS